jgi:hypothetical protein
VLSCLERRPDRGSCRNIDWNMARHPRNFYFSCRRRSLNNPVNLGFEDRTSFKLARIIATSSFKDVDTQLLKKHDTLKNLSVLG